MSIKSSGWKFCSDKPQNCGGIDRSYDSGRVSAWVHIYEHCGGWVYRINVFSGEDEEVSENMSPQLLESAMQQSDRDARGLLSAAETAYAHNL